MSIIIRRFPSQENLIKGNQWKERDRKAPWDRSEET